MTELYQFQKRSVDSLLGGKYFIVAGCGSGKNPMSVVWAAKKCRETGKKKILVVTTASKARTTDHIDDFNSFVPLSCRKEITIITLSWHKLRAWVAANWGLVFLAPDYQLPLSPFHHVFDFGIEFNVVFVD